MSKYNNRLVLVCRDCVGRIGRIERAPADAIAHGEAWLTPGGELVATGEPEACPLCGAVWQGFVADSEAEAIRYAQLVLLQRGGEIRELVVHPRYLLLAAFRDGQGQYHRGVEYEADFAYLEGERQVVEEVKGFESDVWKIKQKLFLRRYTDLVLRVIPAAEVV
jgi:hypothetical protein